MSIFRCSEPPFPSPSDAIVQHVFSLLQARRHAAGSLQLVFLATSVTGTGLLGCMTLARYRRLKCRTQALTPFFDVCLARTLFAKAQRQYKFRIGSTDLRHLLINSLRTPGQLILTWDRRTVDKT